MLSPRIQDALNKQINVELQAFYNYLAMTAWFEEQNLSGFAQWMKIQGAEENNVHAMKLFDYVVSRDGVVRLEPIAKPPCEFKSVKEVLETALRMEQENTTSIHNLYRLATEENDFATASMLKWFIDEQVEEEKNVTDVLKLIHLAGDDRAALLVLNQQMGQRSATTAKEKE